jgi:guanylate kinase
VKKHSKNRGLIFVVSGPSGSGKTTLVKKLLNGRDLKNKLTRSISWTTRPRRSGEQAQRDYFFVSQKRFRQARKAKKLLEWTKYLGYYYATPKDFIVGQLKKGKHIILCLDLKGAAALKRRYPKNTITIFVLPPSQDVLWQRIIKRCHKTKSEEVKERLRLARQEMAAVNRYDYCLVNKDLKQATQTVAEIICKEMLKES